MSKTLEEVRGEIASIKAAIQAEYRKFVRPENAGLLNAELTAANNATRKRLDDLEDDLRELQSEETRLRGDREAGERAASEARGRTRIQSQAEWSKRFHTSLALANGAAFAAIASKLLDKDVPQTTVAAAIPPVLLFGIGVIAAGLLPYFLATEREKAVGPLAGVAAVSFALGIFAVVGGLISIASAPATPRCAPSAHVASQQAASAAGAARKP